MGKLFCIVKVADATGVLIDEVTWPLSINESLLNAELRFRHENGGNYEAGAQFIAENVVLTAP